ncbi:MAG: ubiquinol-cytochrome c reductase iron-sulfur subunit, partial [Gammaproteobacteria bacterium]
MSDEHDKRKRDFLVGVTAGMGTVATGAVLVPFVASWGPSEKAKAAGAPVEVDLGKIQPGEMQVYEWRGKP